MCFGLKLSLGESQDLLSKAGYTLSKSITRDLVFMYFIEKKIFNINKVNDALYDFKLKLLPIN